MGGSSKLILRIILGGMTYSSAAAFAITFVIVFAIALASLLFKKKFTKKKGNPARPTLSWDTEKALLRGGGFYSQNESFVYKARFRRRNGGYEDCENAIVYYSFDSMAQKGFS